MLVVWVKMRTLGVIPQTADDFLSFLKTIHDLGIIQGFLYEAH